MKIYPNLGLLIVFVLLTDVAFISNYNILVTYRWIFTIIMFVLSCFIIISNIRFNVSIYKSKKLKKEYSFMNSTNLLLIFVISMLFINSIDDYFIDVSTDVFGKFNFIVLYLIMFSSIRYQTINIKDDKPSKDFYE